METKKLEQLKMDLRDGVDYRREMYTDEEWERLEDYWQAKYQGDRNQILAVPILVTDGQRQISDVMGGEPYVLFDTDDTEMVASARVLTTRMNHLITENHLVDELLDSLQDTATLGTGFLMDFFGTEYRTSPQTSQTGQEQIRWDKKGRRTEYHRSVKLDLPATLAAHPMNIIVPAGTTSLNSATGFWHKYFRHIDEVKADDRYYSRFRSEITPNALEEVAGETGKIREQEPNLVELFDYFDIRSGRCTTFSINCAQAAFDELDTVMIRLGQLPLHNIIFNKNRRQYWGTADFTLQEPLAMEANDIRTQQQRLRRLQVVKGIFDKEMLDAEEEKAFEQAIKQMESDEQMVMIGVRPGAGKSIRDFLADFKPTQPYDLIPQYNLTISDIQRISGTGQVQRGQVAEGRHTKYEVGKADEHFERTMYRKRRQVQQVMIDIVHNWCKLIYEFWTEPQIVKTYDAAGLPVMVEFRGADLKGDYRITMGLDSAKIRNQQDKMNEAMAIFDRAMPLIQAQVINPVALWREFMTSLGSNWNIDAMLQQPQQMPPGQAVPFGQFQQGFRNPQAAQQQAAMQQMKRTQLQMMAGGGMPGQPGPLQQKTKVG